VAEQGYLAPLDHGAGSSCRSLLRPRVAVSTEASLTPPVCDPPGVQEAFAAVFALMATERCVVSRLLLTRLLLSASPAPAARRRLERLRLGLLALHTLPAPWAQRCSLSAHRPQAILFTLLANQQLAAAAALLTRFPWLRDENMVVAFAERAVACPATCAPSPPPSPTLPTSHNAPYPLSFAQHQPPQVQETISLASCRFTPLRIELCG
jgi:hypothetical protein